MKAKEYFEYTCNRLNELMQKEKDFSFTKDFHPIMMERSEEYRKLYQGLKMEEFYRDFKLPTIQN